MRLVDSSFSGGAICVLTAELARYNEFHDSIEQLLVPKGTRLFKGRGLEFVRNLNNMITECLESKDTQWIWIMGDDHTFEPDCLIKLLEHNVDVIVPLVSMRSFPCEPVLVHGPVGLGQRYQWEEIKDNGNGLMQLQPGDTVGTAGMLLKRKVFETLNHPWFEVGRVYPDSMTEDIWFSSKLWKYGFEVCVATDVVMGHLTTFNLIPRQNVDGSWSVQAKLLAGQIPYYITIME